MFVVADDLGWNDVSWHSKRNAQIPTPTLDALAMGGVKLQNYYVQPVCSPTRSCILSGRHVIHTGIYNPFSHGTVNALQRRYTLLPEKLRAMGFRTAMVGKWVGYGHIQESTLPCCLTLFLVAPSAPGHV